MSDNERDDDKPDDYEVGYGKPPKSGQFKKGKSGNPKGRPKGTRNFKTDVLSVLNEPVKVSRNGKTKSVSTQAATLARLREKALKGDQKALDRLLAFASTYNDDEPVETATKLSKSDAEIVEAYNKRLLRRHALAAAEAKTNEKEEDDDSWLD